MAPKICLDTGIITQYFSKKVPLSINHLMQEIESGAIEAYCPTPILIEVFYQICKIKGKAAAQANLAHFMKNFHVALISPDSSLIFKAGALKCQHRHELSYNDCLTIGFSLNQKIELHTTEKGFKKLIPRLKVKSYNFGE